MEGSVEFEGIPVIGAEVFIGCRKAVTNSDGIFLIDVPASPLVNGQPKGKQLIRAQSYSTNPIGMLKGKVSEVLKAGINDLVGRPIKLQPPPEWRRRIEIHGSLDILHQVAFGHNSSDHPKPSASVFVQVDPGMSSNPDWHDAALAARSGTFDFKTERCGGERAHFSGTISMFDPAQPPPPEGPNAIEVTWQYELLDGDDGVTVHNLPRLHSHDDLHRTSHIAD